MSQYEQGEWDMFELITSAMNGKAVYFLDANGFVYSRNSGKTLTVYEAYNEFLDWIEKGWAET